jgi:hypothetical protein
MAEAFEAYKKYLAIKSHFTRRDYDYFKYNGKVKATFPTFEKRKDRYFFFKLAKQKNVEQFLVASFIELGENVWVGDLLESMATSNAYVSWLKRQEALTYTFKNDLDKLDEDFNSNLKVVDGQHPNLLKLLLQREICIETVVILNDLANFTDYWGENICDTVVWPDICNKIHKYLPFIKYDKEKYRNLVLEKFINKKQ